MATTMNLMRDVLLSLGERTTQQFPFWMCQSDIACWREQHASAKERQLIINPRKIIIDRHKLVCSLDIT